MNAQFATFVEDIRNSPKFAEAASKDVVWTTRLRWIELSLDHYSRAADPADVELFDRLMAVISDEGSTIKQRLLAIVDIMSEFKYGKHGRN